MEKPIGALWINYTKNDDEFFSGYIEIDGVQHRIIIFRNWKKKGERSPDFNIYEARKKEEGEPF